MAEHTVVLLLVLALWSGAAAVKAWWAISRNTRYTFRVWDGGLLLAGKALGRRGVQIRRATMTLMSLGIVALLAGVLELDRGLWLMLALAAVAGVSDFATATRDPRPEVPEARATR